MADLRRSAVRFQRLGRDLLIGTRRVIREVALETTAKLIRRTPVDTGRARSNWFIGINAPSRQSRKRPVSPGAAIGRAAARLTSSRLQDTVYITNNLPYIQRLNRGWSAQAPPGYVQQAVREATKDRLVRAKVFE